MIRVHELPAYGMPDYWRFTPRGLRTLLERGRPRGGHGGLLGEPSVRGRQPQPLVRVPPLALAARRARPARSGLGLRPQAVTADSRLLAPLLVVALTVVGAVVRLLVLHDSLFADELSTYWVVSGRSFGGVISTVHTDAEITPPLFFALSWLTTQNRLHRRRCCACPPTLAGVATIPLVYLIGARTVGRWAAAVGAARSPRSPRS